VDLPATAAEAMDFQFGAGDIFFLLEALGERGQFVPAEGLHDGLTANVGGDIEEFAQRLVNHPHPPLLIEPKNALDHAVEERLLAGLELGEEPGMNLLP